MNVKRDYLYELQIYKAQNPETGEFDVVFEIEGKKLYAHKSKLCEVSTTFDAMLSERWTTQNEPIQINSYSFDNFKQLITFIYSGDCKFTLDNIFTMVDIAEFYNVSAFKTACQDFLLKTARNLGDVYPLLELTYKYSMESLKKHLLDFISRNLLTFIKLNEFQALPRSIIFDVVQSNQDTVIQEELFEAIYEWAENQAIEKQNHDANLNLNDAIKKQLTEVLPLIKFQKMKNEFLIKFV
uniref:BTB domain-containing protein n=1 Tax=Panagrolaimus sp. ES5 TaxID=591445 RepID=A0AC34FTY5_9BILA